MDFKPRIRPIYRRINNQYYCIMPDLRCIKITLNSANCALVTHTRFKRSKLIKMKKNLKSDEWREVIAKVITMAKWMKKPPVRKRIQHKKLIAA